MSWLLAVAMIFGLAAPAWAQNTGVPRRWVYGDYRDEKPRTDLSRTVSRDHIGDGVLKAVAVGFLLSLLVPNGACHKGRMASCAAMTLGFGAAGAAIDAIYGDSSVYYPQRAPKPVQLRVRF